MYDGSNVDGLQVVLDPSMCEDISVGASIAVQGRLVESPKPGQAAELQADGVDVLGSCDAATYPIQKRGPSMEYLREVVHLRPRDPTIASMLRIRNAVEAAVHAFYQAHNFLHVQTPIITGNDCEGGGEAFDVSAPGYDSADQTFFGRAAHLTVSGQLHAEVVACAMSRVYVLGPTFRAENSHSTRHLAEFYMLEAEIAFADMHNAMDVAEACLKHCGQDVLDKHSDDISVLSTKSTKDAGGSDAALSAALAAPFARMTYTEAIEALQQSSQSFKYPVVWGIDLKFEHEQWLAQDFCRSPVFVTDYPAAIKPFYARMNADGTTVASFDLLVPGIGELIGGSGREERPEVLERLLHAHGISSELDWYQDLRRYGTVPHAGFGIGFERMIQYFTGIANIRDAIPFPRHAGGCRL